MAKKKTLKTKTKNKSDLVLTSGSHIILDLMHCTGDPEWLVNAQMMQQFLSQKIKESRLNILSEEFYSFTPLDGYDQAGYTGIFMLSESHVTIHTFPENASADFDIFVCNVTSDNTEKAFSIARMILNILKPLENHAYFIARKTANDLNEDILCEKQYTDPTNFGFIYMIENQTDGKVYIGLTSQGNAKRPTSHLRKSSNRYLRRAVEKYGAENFKLKILDYCATKEELDEKEIYYIDFFRKSLGFENVYNFESGGNKNKIVYVDNERRTKLANPTEKQKLQYAKHSEIQKQRYIDGKVNVDGMRKWNQSPEGIAFKKENNKKWWANLSEEEKKIKIANNRLQGEIIKLKRIKVYDSIIESADFKNFRNNIGDNIFLRKAIASHLPITDSMIMRILSRCIQLGKIKKISRGCFAFC